MEQGQGAVAEEDDIFYEADDSVGEDVSMAGDYDTKDGTDPADVYAKTSHIKVDFNRKKPGFFFIQLEMLMESSGCASQWMKRLLLQRNLPSDVVEDLEDIFSKGQTAAGATAYIDAKTRVLELYGPKPNDKYKMAKELVMTGKPSQYCRQLIQILCSSTQTSPTAVPSP